MRDGGCELVKCAIQGEVSGKRRRGRPKTSHSSNITKWMNESIRYGANNEGHTDRDEWKRLIRCAVRAANHHP